MFRAMVGDPYRELIGPRAVVAADPVAAAALGLRIEASADPYVVALLADDEAAGARLAAAARAAWGTPDVFVQSAEMSQSYWIDASAERRACADGWGLEVSEFVAPARLLELVPWQAVGGPASALRTELGPDGIEPPPGEIWWYVPGVGVGSGTTQFVAKIAEERVVSLSAFSGSTREAGECMRDLLVERLGPPTLTRDRYAGWAREVPIQLRWFRGVGITVGERLVPPDPRPLEWLLAKLNAS